MCGPWSDIELPLMAPPLRLRPDEIRGLSTVDHVAYLILNEHLKPPSE
jgi:hypothetical protein